MKDEHAKDKHVKDAAQDVAETVMQDVAEDVLGAAEDGSVKVLVVARFIFQRRNTCPTQACHPPRCPWATREGRAREGRGAGRFGRRATGRAQDLAFGARAACAFLASPPPPPPSLCSSR